MNIPRKLLSAYIASFVVVYGFALISIIDQTDRPYAASNFAGWGLAAAMYAVPVIFIYGICVSVLADVCVRNRWSPGLRMAVSLAIHALFGFGYGLVFQLGMFSLYGGAASIVFFLADRLLAAVWGTRRRPAVLIGLVLPVLLFAGTTAYLYAAAPSPPAFTEREAVRFATSGKGTWIELYPKEAGVQRLTIGGYQVERETGVTAVGKERYEVTFTERWTKDGASGSRWMRYLVGRGSMKAHGGGGENPPYQGASVTP